MKHALTVCVGLGLFAAMAAAGPEAMLESLTPAERANGRLSVMPLSEDPGELMDACRRIGALWNDGQYDAALDQFHLAAGRYGEEQLSTTIDWKTPVPTIASTKWGTDVKINNRDSVYEVHYDVHRATGNLIAVTHSLLSGNLYSINLSTDGGLHWSETAIHSFAGMANHGTSGAFVGDHFYLNFGSGPISVIRKYSAVTGAIDTFSSGLNFQYAYTLAASDTVLEVALRSNQDDFDNRLFHAATTKNGKLMFCWSDTAGYNWTQIATLIADAQGGLDMCYNEGFADRQIWVSYFNDDDTVKIGAINIGTEIWQNVAKLYSGATGMGTAISAYRDTVLCAFNFSGATAEYCRYLRSYNGGSSWAQGALGNSTDSTADLADVTLRGGGGMGAAYRFYSGTGENLRYSWRSYPGTWSVPVRMSDSAAFPCKPSIEYLGSGVYGVAFSSWNPGLGRAYFDRSDWVTGVAGGPSSVQLPVFAKVFPSPARDRATVSWSLAQPGRVSVALYDLTGRLVSRTGTDPLAAGRHEQALDTRALPSGVYFVRIEGAGPGHTRKLVVIR